MIAELNSILAVSLVLAQKLYHDHCRVRESCSHPDERKRALMTIKRSSESITSAWPNKRFNLT